MPKSSQMPSPPKVLFKTRKWGKKVNKLCSKEMELVQLKIPEGRIELTQMKTRTYLTRALSALAQTLNNSRTLSHRSKNSGQSNSTS